MEVPAGESTRTILNTPDLTIVVERSDDMLVARVAGRLDGTTAESFRRAMESASLGDHRTCLLDMADVTFVASEGLRALLLLRQVLSKSSCKLALCSLQASVQSVFQISGFTSVLAIYPDAQTAADN